jgi:two-component system CheB/CheR fusion protein
MKNLLNSTEIATLFLDKELNIRRFTDPVTKIFKVRSEMPVGLLRILVNDLNYPDMGRDAQDVKKNLTLFKYNKQRTAGGITLGLCLSNSR